MAGRRCPEATTTPCVCGRWQPAAVCASSKDILLASLRSRSRRMAGRFCRAATRDEGKKLGRPRISQATEDAIRVALAQSGRPGVRKIAAQFGVDPGTVQRISRPLKGANVAVA